MNIFSLHFLQVVWVLWKRDLMHYWRNRTRAIVALTMPMLWLFIFGNGLSGSLGGSQQGFIATGSVGYIQFIFPGIIAMSLIFNAIFSSLNTVKDKEVGFLKEILVAPVSRTTIVIGRALGASSTAALQGVLILILAPFVGMELSLPLLLALLPMIWLVAFSLTSIGMVLVSFFDNQESFQYVVNFVNMPMFFLSGALFPLGNVPSWMEPLVRLNPASYAVDAMRRIVLHYQGISSETINSLSFSVFGHSLTLWADCVVLIGCSIILLYTASVIFNRNP